MKMNSIRLKVVYIETNKLKPNPKNPRLIKDPDFSRLCQSLREDPEFFEARPILCNRDFQVFAGTQRLKAAQEIGLKEVPVIMMDNPGLEARRMLKDNLSAGTWDYAALEDSFDLDFLREVGFGDEELGLISQAAPIIDDPDLDIIPPIPEEAITKPGDLWLLGSHRLLCGDSAKAQDVDRLLEGQKVQLVNTDPPYNVNVPPRSNNGIAAAIAEGKMRGQQGMDRGATRKRTFVRGRDMAAMHQKKPTTGILRAKDRPLANDFIDDERFAELLRDWFSNIQQVLEPGRSFYIWGGYSNISNYPSALKDCGLYFSQMIIWVKEHPVLTRKDFMGNHEWCFYGWHEGAAHKFFGPNNATDVWAVKKINPQSMVHLTEKPVELAVRAITFSSLKGESVLDLFGGSGSTLVACEQSGRKAFLMELDPLYCDVIVKRYETLTGKKPVLVKQ
jgi:DNA modification methylase